MEEWKNWALQCGAGDGAAIAAEPVLRRMAEEKRRAALGDLPGLKGLIAMVFPYYAGDLPGNLSLYARGEDYHKVLGRAMEEFCRLAAESYPYAHFRAYADISPYPEAQICARAGLGAIGQNGLLLTPRWGSYVFCGVVATDLPLKGGNEPGGCIECGKCRAACPGGALTPNGFCEERCLSAITQKRGELALWEEQLIQKGQYVWGCDRCQQVCPYNEKAEQTSCGAFSQNLVAEINEEELAELSDRRFRKEYAGRAFSWRGIGPLKRNLKLKKE